MKKPDVRNQTFPNSYRHERIMKKNLSELASNSKPVDLKQDKSSSMAKPLLKSRKAKRCFVEPVALFVSSLQQEAL